MASIFIVDGTQYPDPGAEVTPEQFKNMMVGFIPELANSDMTTEKAGKTPSTDFAVESEPKDEGTAYHP